MHQADYEKYFVITETSEHGRKVTYNKEAIDAHEVNTIRMVCTHLQRYQVSRKDAQVYRMKDASELTSNR